MVSTTFLSNRQIILSAIVAFISAHCVHSSGIVPELYLGVRTPSDGKGLATATLEPTLKWSTKGTILNDLCDYSGGVTLRTSDMGQLPFSVYGTIQKSSVFGWNCKAKFDTDSSSLDFVDYDIQAQGGPTNLLLRVSGYINSKKSELQNIACSQGFRVPFIGGKLSVSPAYSLNSKRAKVGFKYNIPSTQISIDANKDEQKLTVAYDINESNTIVPSVTSNGKVAIDYHYYVGNNSGKLSTMYRPNDSTTIEYQDGPWIASTSIPIDGYFKPYAKPKFFIRRSLTVE
jgi:hypothetical protein